jgi:hypothetical protein
MTLEEALRGQLIAYAPLAALVGDRVYQMQLTETATLPAVSFFRISTVPLSHRNISHFGRVRVQVDGWAESAAEIGTLRHHLKSALVGWQQGADPRVDGTLLQDDRTIIEPQLGRWRASIDFTFFAEEGS